MIRPGLETRFRRIAVAMLAVSLSVATGAGVAQWAVADANGFYMAPTDHYETPAYARRQPIADTFWQRQESLDGSTAISAQPAYRSAWGS